MSNPPPPAVPLSLISPSRSSRSLSSASLAVPSASPATGGPAVLPTSVDSKKSRTACLHRSSVGSSGIFVWPRPRVGPGSFLVSSRSAALRVFCRLFYWGQFLNRCSRVWILY